VGCIHSVHISKETTSLPYKKNWVQLFREIVAVYDGNCMKPRISGYNAELWTVPYAETGEILQNSNIMALLPLISCCSLITGFLFSGTSLEPVVNPTTQASSLSL
jgi:hypothetical protein